ncbi:MAG: endonuclease/exonuclease/phosphatase family protein [Sarcina sp.]
MKILTLNCHSWQEENQLEKIKYLASVLAKKKYDVIALQEVSQSIKSKYIDSEKILKEDNFVVILISELKKIGCNDYNLFWDYGKIGYDVFEEGIAILSRHKIIDTQSKYVSKSESIENWRSRKIIKINLDYKGKKVCVCSCHLGWWDDENEPLKKQVDKLCDFIENDKECIVLGDFNSEADVRAQGYDYILEKGLMDTYKMAKEKCAGITVKGKIAGWESNVDKRIDIVFTNFESEVVKSKVIFNGENEEVISDHYGVEVNLEV